MKNDFIVVKDNDIIIKMNEAGFEKLYSDGNMSIYLNKIPNNFKFSEFDLNKVCFTNKLFF